VNQDLDAIRRRARRRAALAATHRRDPRFRAVMGRLVALGLLDTNIEGIRPHRRRISVEDACWAGLVEPRIFELLPALVLKKPGIFRGGPDLPDDLREVVAAARRGECTASFRGVPASDYLRWIPRIGHRGKLPTLVKTFRLDRRDIELFGDLKRRLGLSSDVGVLRAALRALDASTRSSRDR
jgi:hypothetical protein